MAIINNVAYSWSMITLSSTALGIDEGSTTLEGVSAIKWSKKRKVESNYGMGGKPVSRGFGNITYTASITMDYATQQLLRSVYGSLLEIGEFDLIISFANPMASDDWTTTTVTLKGCIFTEDCLESQQDDTNITHEFDLNPFDIQIVSEVGSVVLLVPFLNPSTFFIKHLIDLTEPATLGRGLRITLISGRCLFRSFL